jgi:hypothetical protein
MGQKRVVSPMIVIIIIIINKYFALKTDPIEHGGSDDNTTYFQGMPCFNLGLLPMNATSNEVKENSNSTTRVSVTTNVTISPFLCFCIHCCVRSHRSGQRRKHRFPASQLARWPVSSKGCSLVCFAVVA